jgi:hypothetical protein
VLPIARIFLLLGVAFLIMGGLFLLFDRLGVSLGRLPGDIKVEGSNFTCLIGLGTSIVLSILLTVVLNLLLRFLGK